MRDSGGTAIAVTEAAVHEGTERICRLLGLQASAGGGACVAATEQLLGSGWLSAEDTVVGFNTGHGLKYA